MNYKGLLLLGFVIFSIDAVNAQMINGKDTLYGYEWIDYSQSYFKI